MFFFFFNDTATTEIYTLSLHDALPILVRPAEARGGGLGARRRGEPRARAQSRCAGRTHEGALEKPADRKSTRLNSSHANISYAVFCLKKKKKSRPKSKQTRYPTSTS